MNEVAGRNQTMFNKVKKGDILLIPHLPNWGQTAIVKSTEYGYLKALVSSVVTTNCRLSDLNKRKGN